MPLTAAARARRAEGQHVVGLFPEQVQPLQARRRYKDLQQQRALPLFGGGGAQGAPPLDPYPASHGLDMEADISTIEEERLEGDFDFRAASKEWQQEVRGAQTHGQANKHTGAPWVSPSRRPPACFCHMCTCGPRVACAVVAPL